MAIHTWVAAGALNFCLLASLSSQAAQPGDRTDQTKEDVNSWLASLGVRHTDNVNRTPDNEQSDTLPQVGLSGDYARYRNRLITTLSANLLYSKYPSSMTAAENVPTTITGAATLEVTAGLVRDYLLWDITDYYGDTLINPLAADAPANQQNFNVFSTGPTLHLPFGARNQFSLHADWYRSDFSESESDGEGFRESAELIRQTSEKGSAGLYYSAMQLKYPNAILQREDKIQSAGLLWNMQGARSRLELQGGYSEQESNGIKQGSPMGRLILNRDSANGGMGIEIGRQFSNAAQAFQNNQSFFGTGASSQFSTVFAVTGVFRSDYGMLSYRRAGASSQIEVYTSARNERYTVRGDLDNNQVGLGLTAGKMVNERIRLGAGASWNRRELISGDLNTVEQHYSMDLSYLLRQDLDLAFRLERNSGNLTSSSDRYVENAQSLTLHYRPQSRPKSRQ